MELPLRRLHRNHRRQRLLLDDGQPVGVTPHGRPTFGRLAQLLAIDPDRTAAAASSQTPFAGTKPPWLRSSVPTILPIDADRGAIDSLPRSSQSCDCRRRHVTVSSSSGANAYLIPDPLSYGVITTVWCIIVMSSTQQGRISGESVVMSPPGSYSGRVPFRATGSHYHEAGPVRPNRPRGNCRG